MEFRFNVNELFKQPIVELGSNLIPPGFQGDRRQLWDAVTKVSEVVNTMGEASAAAQGLSKPITTADRLRNSENQKIYVLVDRSAQNGKGAITGMLKTGQKGLYLFDREGEYYQVQPQCILDFYVHESKQRSGYGKMLFEHMLEKEKVEPISLAIDRPSDKFLGFLKKHYNLHSAIRQMNNYVVFDGFFPEMAAKEDNSTIKHDNSVMSKPNKRCSNGLQQNVTSPYGRYGAPRPVCSMGQIIHNQKSTVNLQEPTGHSMTPPLEQPPPAAYPQSYQNEGLSPQPQSAPNLSQPMYGNTTPLHHTLSAPANDAPRTRCTMPQAGNGLGEIASDHPSARSKLMLNWNRDTSLSEPEYHWPFLKPSRLALPQSSKTNFNPEYYSAPYATMQDVVPPQTPQPQQTQLSPSQYQLYAHSQSNVVDHNQQFQAGQEAMQQMYQPTVRTPEQEQLLNAQQEYMRQQHNAMMLQQHQQMEMEQRHVQDSRVPQTLAEMKEYQKRVLAENAREKPKSRLEPRIKRDEDTESMQGQISRTNTCSTIASKLDVHSKQRTKHLRSKTARPQRYQPGNGMQDINDADQSPYVSLPQTGEGTFIKQRRNVKSAHSSVSQKSIKSPQQTAQPQPQAMQYPMTQPQQMMQQPQYMMPQQQPMGYSQMMQQTQQTMQQQPQQMMQQPQQMMQQPQQIMPQQPQQMMPQQPQQMAPQQPQQMAPQPQQMAPQQAQQMMPQHAQQMMPQQPQQMMQQQPQQMMPQQPQQMMQQPDQMLPQQPQQMMPQQQMMQPMASEQPITPRQQVAQSQQVEQPSQEDAQMQFYKTQPSNAQQQYAQGEPNTMPPQTYAPQQTQGAIAPQQYTFATQQQEQAPQTHYPHATAPQQQHPHQQATIPLAAVTGHTNVQAPVDNLAAYQIPPAEAAYAYDKPQVPDKQPIVETPNAGGDMQPVKPNAADERPIRSHYDKIENSMVGRVPVRN